MPSLFRPPTAIFALLLAASAVAFGAHVATRGSGVRFASARERADAQCKAFLAQPDRHGSGLCSLGPTTRPMTPRYKEAQDSLASARRHLARGGLGDKEAAEREIATAFDQAAAFERRGTLFGSLLAASVVSEGVKVIEANRVAIAPSTRLALANRVHLGSAAHPFESVRIHEEWALAHDDRAGLWPFGPSAAPAARTSGLPGPAGEALLAAAMAQTDAALGEMDRATAAGDVARCTRAAGGLPAHVTGGADYAAHCERAAGIVRADKRLAAMKAEALSDRRLMATNLPTRPLAP
jgi:hypothetical protein